MILASLLISLTASAAPTIPAQNCTNASRGIVLIVPQIAAGQLAGPLKVTKLIRTLTEVPASSVTNLQVGNDGLVSFNGKDVQGSPVKVASTRDSVGRLVIQVWRKDQGMIGFTCPASRAK